MEKAAEKEVKQEDVQSKPVEPDNRSTYGLLTLIETIVAIVGVSLSLILLLSGTCRLFGRETSVVGIIWYLINIFNLSRDRVYRTLVCAAIGIAFIVITIFIVRNLIRTIKESIKVFHSLKNRSDRDFGYFHEKRVISYGMNTLALFGIFNVLCTLAGGEVILGRTIPVFVVIGILFLLRGWVISYYKFESPDLKETILNTCRDLLFIAGISFLFFVIDEPSFKEISNGFTMLIFGGLTSGENSKVNFNSFYTAIGAPALFAIMAILFVVMVFRYTSMLEATLQGDLKKIIIITGILMIIQQILKIVMGMGSVSFSSFWRTLMASNYLEIILLYAMLLILEVMIPPTRKGKEDKPKKTGK